MRTGTAASVFAAVLALLTPTVTLAAVEVNDDVRISNWLPRPQDFNGGPFRLRVWNDTSAGVGAATGTATDFDGLAFCVQTNQTFNWNTPYNIDALATQNTYPLPPSGQTQTRNLSGYSAWVYTQFVQLGLTPATTALPTGITSLDLKKFQWAIWAGITLGGAVPTEALIGSSSSLQAISSTPSAGLGDDWGDYASVAGKNISRDKFKTLIGTNIYGPNASNGVWGWDIDERSPYKMIVMNDAQDQIFVGSFLDFGSPSVPEPASLVVWGLLGTAGAAVALRSRKRRGWSDGNRRAIYDVIHRG